LWSVVFVIIIVDRGLGFGWFLEIPLHEPVPVCRLQKLLNFHPRTRVFQVCG
jgi:hypothetical protein